MATINSIDPTKSKKTGGVSFVIDGTGFSTTDLSNDFSGGTFYTDISASGGSITDTDKLELALDITSGSFAGIKATSLFPDVFDTAFLLEYDITTLPSMNNVKIAAVKAEDNTDATTYFEVYLGHTDSLGYFLRTEGLIAGSAVYSNTTSIDPASVEGLKIIRTGSRFTSYMKISGQYVELGTYLGYGSFDSNIQLYSENSVPLSQPYSVFSTGFEVSHAVSLVNKPATIFTVSDTEIAGETQPNEIGIGDIIVGFPDATIATLAGGFEYRETTRQARDSKSFDMAISIYNFYIDPSRNELFTSAGSFVWDKNYWIAPSKQNKNLYIPSLWDPSTAGVPSTYLQSGHGDHDNIKLIDIVRSRAESLESWHARLNHGTYFIRNVPYYLFSDESISTQLQNETTEDGRSKKNLKFPPKPGIPISASTLTTDIESGLIVDKRRFQKKGKFTGRVENGVELDTSVVTNIDTTKDEFVVKYNPNNQVINWRIPTEGSTAGTYSFTLPEIPLRECPIMFTRTDIFTTRKHLGSPYGDPETIYNEVYYGQPLEDAGDYSVNYETGEVLVILDQTYIDMGYVSYVFDYPAVIEFNDNYLVDRGSSITSPTSSDLNDLDIIGESDGEPFQIFRMSEFPILDFSDSQFLDSDNFNLFLYDESDNTFETDWTRIRNIESAGMNDKVYQLNPDQGTIIFGNNITGKIPQKYKKIVAGYKNSVRIEYEPKSSVDYWTGRDTDLNLSRNSLNSGFLYLSRKELIPETISVAFSTGEINALEFAELQAVVRDIDGDPVPGAELTFEIINGQGDLEEETLVTNSDGIATTTYIPSGDIQDIGIFSYLYEEGSNPSTLGDPRPSVYGNSGALVNNLIAAEEEILDAPEDIYLFKVYDDGDFFNAYDNQTRRGGSFYVLFDYDSGTMQNELIKPVAVSGKILIFDRSLPQPFNAGQPEYEPNLRGFAIIGKKQIQAKASLSEGLISIDSDIATLAVEYSPIQKGEWTLPIPPTYFNSSEIDRATYININP